MFQFKLLSALIFLSGSAHAFVPSTAFPAHSFALNPKDCAAISDNSITGQRAGGVSLNLLDPTQVVPVVVFGAAVAASIAKDEGTDFSFKKKEKKESVAVVEVEEDVSEKVEPAPAPVIEPAPAPVEPAPAPEEPAPAPVAETAPEPVIEAGKEISELKKKVAKTVDGERAKMDRLKLAEAKKEPAPAPVAEETEEEAEPEEEKTEQSRMKKIKRVLKKMIMPWKKWSDIS